MTRTLRLFLLAALALALAAQPAFSAPAEKRVALVIGNGAYREAPLKNPVNDAADMAAALRRLGFEVTLLKDATTAQMEKAVRDFGLRLRQGGTGLFYYAGHGVQVGGVNYLVPVNAVIQSESDVKYGCMDAGLVLGKMEDAGNGLNLVILDACRNNPFARSFRSASQGLAKMDAPTGSLIAYSTAPGAVAADGAGRNGLYTQHLLRNISTPGLSVEELFKRVRVGVAGESAKRQVPWEASSLIGQFSFAPGAGPAGGVQTASLAPAPTPAPAPAAEAGLQQQREAEEQAARRRAEETAALERAKQSALAQGASAEYFQGTVWRSLRPNSATRLAYIRFDAGGRLAYSYASPGEVKQDGTDFWRVEGGRLVITWTNGYATETYDVQQPADRYEGRHTVAGASSIDRLR